MTGKLTKWIEEKGIIICGEGYLFELERRGYVQIGSFVPEVVLTHPEAVENLHREYLLCGSNVIEAFTYYGNREKLKLIGKEHLLEYLNRRALDIAKKVAREGGVLFAGNICNTNIWEPNNEESHRIAREMFEEQVKWAKEAGVDFIIAETIPWLGEALLAQEVIKNAGLDSVITMAIGKEEQTRDGYFIVNAMRKLNEAGATIVGLNCARGPNTMIPIIRQLSAGGIHNLAVMPVPYKTSEENPTFQSLCCQEHMYSELESHLMNRHEIAEFAVDAAEIYGVCYMGVCCGGAPYHVRAIAETLGRHPPASEFSPDLSMHFIYGNHPTFKKVHTENKHLV